MSFFGVIGVGLLAIAGCFGVLWFFSAFVASRSGSTDYQFPKGKEQTNFMPTQESVYAQDRANMRRNPIAFLYTHAPDEGQIKWAWKDENNEEKNVK